MPSKPGQASRSVTKKATIEKPVCQNSVRETPSEKPTDPKAGKGGKGQSKKKGSRKAMKKAGTMYSGVKKPFKHRPGFVSKTTLETDIKIKKIPFKTGHVYSKEELMSAVKKL